MAKNTSIKFSPRWSKDNVVVAHRDERMVRLRRRSSRSCSCVGSGREWERGGRRGRLVRGKIKAKDISHKIYTLSHLVNVEKTSFAPASSDSNGSTSLLELWGQSYKCFKIFRKLLKQMSTPYVSWVVIFNQMNIHEFNVALKNMDGLLSSLCYFESFDHLLISDFWFCVENVW